MKFSHSLVLVAVGAAAFAAGRAGTWGDAAVAAQPEKKPAAQPGKKEGAGDAKMQEMMQAMMEKMKPGAEHKRLDALLGDWEGDVQFWMDPGTDPMKSHGTLHREWTLDGHFVVERVDAPAMDPTGPAFKGLGYIGYNTIDKRYENVWLENHATWITMGSGTWDAAKKALVFTSDELDPRNGQRRKTRTIVDLSNPNRQTYEGYTTTSDGKEFKCFDGTFEKKK
jgi:hypothetical protein